MAPNKDWQSVVFRLFAFATLCSSWRHLNVDAGEKEHSAALTSSQASNSTKITNQKLVELAERMLTEIFTARHASQIEILQRRGNEKLSPMEQRFEEHLRFNQQLDLTQRQVRLELIKEIKGKMAFQTIAVGWDPSTNTLVVAGNIQLLDFTHVSYDKNPVKQTDRSFVHPTLEAAGLQESDYPIIKSLAQEDSGARIKVVSPSPEDLIRAGRLEANRTGHQDIHRLFTNIIKNVQAQYYKAEMQIQRFFDGKLEGKQIRASRPFCITCFRQATRIARLTGNIVNEDNRWRMPRKVEIFDLQNIQVPAQPSRDLDQLVGRKSPYEQEGPTEQVTNKSKDIPGGFCKGGGGGGGRGRRSLCSRLIDITEVDADEFGRKLAELPEWEQGKLLSALTHVGVDKLKGSKSAKKAIKSLLRKRKFSGMEELEATLRGGRINDYLVRSQSSEFSKTAISPKVLTESMNDMHEQNIKSAEEALKTGNDGAEESARFANSYKLLNFGLYGKNLIDGVLSGDFKSLITVGTLFGSDQLRTRAGEKLAVKGMELASAGEATIGALLKVTGPIVGTASSTFSIYSLVGHVSRIEALQTMCEKKESLFQERLEENCKLDMDIAIANTVKDVVGVVSSVATLTTAIRTLFTVATGPVGMVAAAVDLLVSIGLQTFAAVQQVSKISSSIVGGLTGNERFATGIRSFIGMGPPQHIQKLLDAEASYNSIVTRAADLLKHAENYQTYVLPTNHTRHLTHINCRNESRPTDAGRVLAGIASVGLSELYYTRPSEMCDIQQEAEEDNEADFQNLQQLREFRVKPDRPSWGFLECNPNALPDRYYPIPMTLSKLEPRETSSATI